MNTRQFLRMLRPAAVVAVAAAFSACSSEDLSPLAGGNTADLTLGFAVSSSRATAGDQVAVAVLADASAPLNGLQGVLRFDSHAMTYLGQAPEGRTLVMVNAGKADQGELKVLSMNVETGLPRATGSLIFQVKSPAYASSLRYEFLTAGDKATSKAITRYKQAVAVVDMPELVIPSSPRKMTMEDWNHALWPDLAAKAELLHKNSPGQYLTNLHYGNANLSAEAADPATCTSVDVLDASYVANVSVENINVLNDTLTQFRDGVVAGNVFPATATPGVEADGSRRLDVNDASAIANEGVGNLRPIVCDPIPGREALTAVRETTTTNIATSTTWGPDKIHVLKGFIRVMSGAVLTVLPGTRVEGDTAGNPNALEVERGAQIIADGTPTKPIVFTCVGPEPGEALTLATERKKGCWAGLLINGRAPINSNLNNTTATSPDGGCLETPYEGVTGTTFLFFYGGCNPNDNSGILRYVRVEYGGFVFTANKELNNLTLGGVGSGTIIDHVQAHAGKDDGLEIFGGTVNVKFYYATANQDDSFDYSSGWTGLAQFLIIQHDSIDSDKGFEVDNTEDPTTFNDSTPCVIVAGVCANVAPTPFPPRPRTKGQVFNVTMVGRAEPTVAGVPRFPGGDKSNGGYHIRRGSHVDIFNTVAIGWRWVLNIDDDPTCGTDLSATNHISRLVIFNFATLDEPAAEANCPPYPAATSVEALYLQDAVRNPGTVLAASSPLRRPFDVLHPDFRPVSAADVSGGVAPPANPFFTTVNYKGAVAPDGFGLASIPWYSGWTRGWQDAANP